MIKAIYFDAIKTIFKPFPSEVGLYQKVIFEITGKQIHEEVLGPILEKAMTETEKLDSVKDNSIQQWGYYPAKVAELIGCDKADCPNVGEKLRYETWGNPNNYRLYDDILQALKMLKENDLYIACVSNEDGWLSKFFDHFEISEYFEFILTSQEVGVEKPNPLIFEKSLERGGFQPSEILFVGDSLPSDYAGSKAVGMNPLLIDREHKIADDSLIKTDDLTKIMDFING